MKKRRRVSAKLKCVVDPTYARTGEYRRVIEAIEQKGKCPFCPRNFKYHKRPPLRRCGDWMLTHNSWPYEDARYHFLIIGKKHREQISDLIPRDFVEIFRLLNWVVTHYHVHGGAFAMRFGETRYTGATVVHLHAHVIIPRLHPRKRIAKTVSFPIG